MKFRRQSQPSRKSSRRQKKQTRLGGFTSGDSSSRLSILRHEPLEDRRMLATFTDGAPVLNIALQANDSLGIVANANSYALTLASGTWTGTDDANVSGNGTSTLTVTTAGIGAFSTGIDISDAGTGTSVAFNDSGANAYGNSFDVTLDDSPASPGLSFNGASSFGTHSLTASIDTNITIDNASVTSGTGSITLSGTGGIVFDDGDISSTGDVTLTATNGSITEQAPPASGPDVFGATVTLTTTGSGNQIGTAPPQGGSGTPLTVNASTLLNATTDDGFITLADTTGDMPLGALNAGAALIELTAVGAITDGDNGGGAPNLTAADGATLTTTGSSSAIGTSAAPIRTAIGALTATTNDGGVYVSDSNVPGLIVNSILAKEGGYTPALNGGNQILVNGNTGTDDVSITATGPILLATAKGATSTIIAPNAVTIDSTGGKIVQGTAGSENILARRASLIAGGTGAIGATGGEIGLATENFSASTASGGIFLAELISGTATSVVAGGAGNDVSVTGSGDTLGIGTITATGSVTLQVANGALVSGSGMSVTGQTVNLTAKSSIGDSGSPFTVTAANVSAAASTSGDGIFINDTTALSTVSATTNAGDVAINYSGGSLNFTAGSGLLAATGPATVSFGNTGGDVALGAVNVASITASGAITATGSVDLTGGDVTLTAGTGIGTTADPIQTDVATLNATTTTGDIVIVQATNPLTVNATTNGYSDSTAQTGSDISVSATSGDMTVGTVSALGTVTLNTGGAVLVGAGSPFNVAGNTLLITAASGVGTGAGALNTSVSVLTADGGAGGLFVSNNKALSVTSASATGGAVSIKTLGDLDIGPVSAAGQAVTLSASGALIDPSGPALNVTAQSATLIAASIGSSSDALETQVSSITATTTVGGIYLSDLGTGTVTFTATAAGNASNIDFTSAGNIILKAATAQGNTVTLTAAGAITNGLTSGGANITAQDLNIVAPLGIGTSANPLGIVVAQVDTASGGANGVFMVNDGPVAITAAALEAPGSGTLTFEASSITILDLGGSPVSLAPGRSLVLKTATGPIVFLNQSNTIETSGGGTITVEAGTTAGSGGVAVLGNLATDGGEIKVTADYSITIGLLNAGAGNVTVESTSGTILDGNGPSNVNVIAGTATLSGSAPTARQLELDEEKQIAAAAAASAEASAEKTSAAAFNAQLQDIAAVVTNDTATVASDQATADQLDAEAAAQQDVVNTETIVQTALSAVAAVADTAKLIGDAIGAGAQAIPLTGDGGAEAGADALDTVSVLANDAAAAAGIALTIDSIKLTNISGEDSAADSALTSAQDVLAFAQESENALKDTQSIAQAAADNALLLSEMVGVVSTQSIAARDQANVIGSSSDPLGLQVAGAVNVTAGPTDSYLQVAGDTALDQIVATGGVTLISTGAITNGASAGTPNVVATSLTIVAAGGIGASANPLFTRVGTLNATNTTSGDIDINNTAGTPAALDITGISNSSGGNVTIANTGDAALGEGISVTGPISVTGAGSDALTLNSGSPLTISANITSAGPINETAAADSPPYDNLTVDAGVTIQSTGSSVSLGAGNNVDVQSGSTIEAATTINITGGAANANVTVEGTLVAPSATIGADPGTNNNNTFTITPSAVTPITVTGGTTTGDNTLNFNANGLPATILNNTITAAGMRPLTFNSFAAVHLLNPSGAGGAIFDATPGMANVMDLTGTGQGAGTYTLNGGTPIAFSGVTDFTFNGADMDDQSTVTPFATALQSWNVAITINGGGGTNSITYDGVSAVSENIAIRPSAPGAGQVIDTNTATGASVAAINYTANTDLIVNGGSAAGAAGDVDALTLEGTNPSGAGTSGNETFTANFAAAGTAANPNVTVDDSASGDNLYNLQNLTNIKTLDVSMGDGDDTFDLVNAGSALNYSIDGGNGDNTLDATGAGTFSVYQGAASDSGSLSTPTNNGNSQANVSFSGIQAINLNGTGPSDNLQVFGTDGNDVFTQEETGVTVNGGPAIGFDPLNYPGNTNVGFTRIDLLGGGGQDHYDLNPSAVGPDPSAVGPSGATLNVMSDSLASGGTVSVSAAGQKDTLTVVPTAGGQGYVSDNTAADQLGLVSYSGIAGINLVGASGDGDTAGVTGTAGDDTLGYTPGATGDSGTITGTLDAAGAAFALPTVTFSQMSPTGPVGLFAAPTLSPLPAATPTINGGDDTAVINGTAGKDNFAVGPAAPQISLNNVAIATGGAANLTLNGVAGSDTFTLNATMPYDNVAVTGANIANNDALVLNGAAGAVTVNLGDVNATPPSLTSISGYNGTGTVTLSDIAQVSINGSGAAANTLTVNGTPNDDTINYTPTLTAAAADGGNFNLAGLNTAFTFNIGATPTNTFTINGGGYTGGDQVNVNGPNSGSSWVTDEAARTITVSNAAGSALKPVILGTGGANEIQMVDLVAGIGNNTFLVSPAPAVLLAGKTAQVGAANFQVPNDLLVNVEGGGASSQNALVIGNPTNGGDALSPELFTAVMRNSSTSGVVRTFQDSGAAEPIQYPDISYTGVGTVQTNTLTKGVTRQQTLVMGPDAYQPNSSFPTAAYLGSGATINVANLAIFPNNEEFPNANADQEWFRVVAQSTGTLNFQVYFQRQFFINTPADAALPGAGELNIDVYDANGNLIDNFGANSSATDNQRRRIPVVAGESYYLQVHGTTPASINGYNMPIVNTPAAVPDSLSLNNVVAQGTVHNSVAPTATTLAAGNAAAPAAATSPNFQSQPSLPLSNLDNFYDGMYLEFTSGALVGQRQLVSGYLAATHAFTFASAFSAAPAAGDTFQIESDDTGRTQLDNLTRDNLPTIYVRLAAADTNNPAPYFDALQDLAGGGTTIGNPASGKIGNGNPPKTTPILIPFWAGNAPTAPFNVAGDPDNGSFRVALFDDTNPTQEAFLGYANTVPNEPGVFQLQVTTPLTDGTHDIVAKIQYDSPSETAAQAGSMQTFDYGSATRLPIVVDTTAPPVYFGTPTVPGTGLVGSSDTGVPGQPATIADRITADSAPTFHGVAEANSIVKIYAVMGTNSTTDVQNGDILLGQTVAAPTDGANQDPSGQWTIASAIDLNDPRYGFSLGGLRTILLTAEDQAGNVSAAKSLRIFIDTQGPTVNAINITGAADFDLFNTKLTPTATASPTPLVNSLDITFGDKPLRVGPEFVYPAANPTLATAAGNYVLVGEHSGVIPITSITLVDSTVAGQPGNTTVTLHFPAKDTPLPDDRYTLSISDAITDNAGDALQGSYNGVNFPTGLPSGDGSQGQTFVGAFTVDSRAHLGDYSLGTVDLDVNGNGLFDPENSDENTRDAVVTMGYRTDRLFEGDFSATYAAGSPAAGAPNGFAKLAAYGQNSNGDFRWLYDLSGTGGQVTTVSEPFQINGLPVAGDFDGSPVVAGSNPPVTKDGDQVGLFDGKNWYLDVLDQGYISAADLAAPATATHSAGQMQSDMAGLPFVGIFDGYTDLGTYQSGVLEFDLASLDPGHVLTGNWNVKVNVNDLFSSTPFNDVTTRPVAGYLNGLGQEASIGFYVPGGTSNDLDVADWYFLQPTNSSLTGAPPVPAASLFTSGTVSTATAAQQAQLQSSGSYLFNLVHPFEDQALGGADAFYQFGNQFSLPVLGVWDPPSDDQIGTQSTTATDDAYVANLYQQVLGRPVAAGELTYWVQQVTGGETPAQVAQSVVTSDEYRADQINKLYESYLGRSADADGLAYWTSVWNATGGPERVQAGIIGSPEYYADAQRLNPGLSPDAAWVTELYANLLDRPVDSTGLNYWVNYLQTHSRGSVVLGFVTSDEFRYDLINTDFETYLNRPVDAPSAQSLLDQMRHGLTQDQLLTMIVSSPEYVNKS